MLKEELKNNITKALKDMGCTDIEFTNGGDDFATATFNCKVVISFRANIPGWQYTGIQLDNSGQKKYKIEFNRIKVNSQK